MAKSLRYNSNKIEIMGISPIFLIELMRHTTYGRIKYPDNDNKPNWSFGQKKSTLINAVFRHLMAYLCGQIWDTDIKDSMHLTAAAWNLMVLIHQDVLKDQYKEFDDLWCKAEFDPLLDLATVNDLMIKNYGKANEQ